MQAGILRAVSVTLLLSITVHAQAGTIYKWVDENGVVHYGQHPPDNNAREVPIRPRPGGDDRQRNPAQGSKEGEKERRERMGKALEGDRLARQEKRQKQQEEAYQRKMQCAQAKDALRQYKQAASLYRIDAEGRRHTLSESGKQQEITRLQATIDKLCK